MLRNCFSCRKLKNGNEVGRGSHGAGLPLADDSKLSPPVMELWEVTSSEQLHAFSVSKVTGGAVNSASKPGTEIGVETINRAHLREFIHYESEAIGIDTPGSDLPAYQWELEPIKSSLTIGPVGSVDVNNKRKSSSRSSAAITSSGADDFRGKQGVGTCYIPSNIQGSPSLVAKIKAVCTKKKFCVQYQTE